MVIWLLCKIDVNGVCNILWVLSTLLVYSKIGTIPSTIDGLFQLTYFGLHNNCLAGLTIKLCSRNANLLMITYNIGTIPSNICSLSNLAYLFVHNNKLHGWYSSIE